MEPQELNIIAIDDEIAFIRLLERVCKPLGALKGYISPELGLQAAMSSEKLDLLLLDLEMETMHGLEVIRDVRSIERFLDLPIVVLTGRQDEAIERAALEAGATDFVYKPVSPEVLRLRIKVHSENRRLRQKLAEQAITDSLTELLNRRGVEPRVRSDICRAARFNTPVSMALLDIDHFKHVNDTYGHPTGDRALQRVASALSNAFQRASDSVARIGGEEFLVVSYGDSIDDFCKRIEQCRLAIAHELINAKALEVQFSVTVSAGAICFTPEQRCDEQGLFELMLENCDAALYEAKVTRDRLVWIEQPDNLEPEFHTRLNQVDLSIRPNQKAIGQLGGVRK